jgi:hypothetical protein
VSGSITIDDVFPWGRSLDEYRRMFALTDLDLNRRILGCGDGPAAFNAAMTRMNKRVVSVDPLYGFGGGEISQRIGATHDLMVERAREAAQRFVWKEIRSPEHMGEIRMQAMGEFLADYEEGKRQGRYLAVALPKLDFPDRSFELALCSHFLFLYSTEFDAAFHVESIVEMARVAGEVRIFPLLNMEGRTSGHVAPVMDALRERGLTVAIERVDYEFQRDGNEMMRVQS